MGFNGNLPNNPIINATGSAFTIGSYVTAGGSPFQAGACANMTVFLKMTIANGSTGTGFKVKVQKSYDGSANSWVDMQTTDCASGTTSNIQTYAITANNTLYAAFDVSSEKLAPGGVQILIQETGAGSPSAGDAVIANVVAW